MELVNENTMQTHAVRPDVYTACFTMYQKYAEKVPHPLSFDNFLNATLLKGLFVYESHLQLLDEMKDLIKFDELFERHLQKVSQD